MVRSGEVFVRKYIPDKLHVSSLADFKKEALFSGVPVDTMFGAILRKILNNIDIKYRFLVYFETTNTSAPSQFNSFMKYVMNDTK